MYEMYVWQRATGRPPAIPAAPATRRPTSSRRPQRRSRACAEAVQIALDRRDNGGDTTGTRDQ